MRFRSKKMERKYRERRALVVRILDEFPMCQRCKGRPSQDVHEVLSRARGGDILDRENCVALCRDCHRFITEHPRFAVEEGWLRHSWDKHSDESRPE